MIVELRSVKKKDWKFILEIRNEQSVRNACHDTSIISWEQHIRHMEKINNGPDNYQWIVTCDGKDAGHTKIINHEFGYMIDKIFRGEGIGTKIIELVCEEAKKLGIKKLHYTTKIDNHASLRVALKRGFIEKKIIKKEGKSYAYSLNKKL